MKVLYVSPNAFMGGAERFIYNIVSTHKRSDEKITCELLFFSEGTVKKQLEDIGIKTHIPHFKFRLLNPWQLLKAVFFTRAVIKEVDPDIIHSTMPYSHIVVSLARIGLKVKEVWFQHGPTGGTLGHMANFFKTDLLFFNSQHTREEHEKMIGRNRKTANQIINLGIPQINKKSSTSIREDLKKKLMIDPTNIILGTAGRISSGKGTHLIIEALNKIDRSIRSKLTLLIIGSPNSHSDQLYQQDLNRLIKDYDLQQTVRSIPTTDKINDYLEAMDILLQPTTIPEAFGLIVAEAMAAKTFVIGSNYGGISEILIDQQTGISFDSNSTNAVEIIQNNIEEVARSFLEKDSYFNEISQMRERAYNMITSNYSLEKMHNTIFSAYKELNAR